jgi:hypothetical protein
MWRYVVWYTDTTVLEEPGVSIFNLYMGSWYLSTKLYGLTSKKTGLKIYYHKNLKIL